MLNSMKNGFIVVWYLLLIVSIAAIFLQEVAVGIFFCVVCLCALFYDVNKVIVLSSFLILFGSCFDFWTTSLCFVVAFSIICIKKFIRNPELGKEYIPPFVFFCLLLLLFVTVKFESSNIKRLFDFVIIIPLLMELFYLRKDINLLFIIRGLFCTAIISCLLAVIVDATTSSVSVFHLDASNINRFMGFCGHEGILAIFSTMLLVFYLVLRLKNQISLWEFYLSICVITLIGGLTRSKTFLLILILSVITYFLILLIKDRKSFVTQFASFLVLVLIFLVLNLDSIQEYFSRFSNSFLESNLLDKITTGRYSIWIRYLKFWANNFLSILFGLGGASTISVDRLPPHNEYIELLTRYGLFGASVFILGITYFIVLFSRNKKFDYVVLIPFISIMLVMLVDPFMQARMIFFLLSICAFYALQDDKKSPVTVELSKKAINTKLKLSVIVPVYKVEEYLDECIQSICDQTYKNLEIILVDDGGVDGCPKICDEWAKKDERIKVIHKTNGGVSSARNAGLKVCTGDLIAFLDADDCLEVEMFAELISQMIEDKSDLAICGFNIVTGDKISPCEEKNMSRFVQTKDTTLIFNRSRITERDGTYYIDNNIPCFLWRMVFTKQVVHGIKFNNNVKVMEDLLFMLTVLQNENIKISYTDKKLYNYRVRSDSAMHMKKEILNNHLAFYNNLEKIVKDQNVLNHFKYTLYADCRLRNEIYGGNEDLKCLKSWASKKNYQASKKYTFGFLLKLRNFLIYHNLFSVLKLLYKIKGA